MRSLKILVALAGLIFLLSTVGYTDVYYDEGVETYIYECDKEDVLKVFQQLQQALKRKDWKTVKALIYTDRILEDQDLPWRQFAVETLQKNSNLILGANPWKFQAKATHTEAFATYDQWNPNINLADWGDTYRIEEVPSRTGPSATIKYLVVKKFYPYRFVDLYLEYQGKRYVTVCRYGKQATVSLLTIRFIPSGDSYLVFHILRYRSGQKILTF